LPFPYDPSFDEFVDLMRQRIGAADAVLPSELHSFKQLTEDVSWAVPEVWYRYAYNELEAQGHLDRNSSLGVDGDAFAQLSAEGTLYWHTNRWPRQT